MISFLKKLLNKQCFFKQQKRLRTLVSVLVFVLYYYLYYIITCILLNGEQSQCDRSGFKLD